MNDLIKLLMFFRDSIEISKLLILLSATAYTLGTYFLSKSIEFQADKLNSGNKESDKNVREMTSPGKINYRKHKCGMILNGLGYALLLLSLAV
jgi:hypothetical protein